MLTDWKVLNWIESELTDRNNIITCNSNAVNCKVKWAEHDAVIKNGSWGNDKKYADDNFCTDSETELWLECHLNNNTVQLECTTALSKHLTLPIPCFSVLCLEPWPNGTPSSSKLESSYKIKTCTGGCMAKRYRQVKPACKKPSNCLNMTA